MIFPGHFVQLSVVDANPLPYDYSCGKKLIVFVLHHCCSLFLRCYLYRAHILSGRKMVSLQEGVAIQ